MTMAVLIITPLPCALPNRTMHNQDRAEYKARMADPAVAAKLAGKAGQWCALTRELASRRKRVSGPFGPASGPSSPPSVPASSTLPLIEKLLTVNPDPSHLWNHRRELLLLPREVDAAAAEVEEEEADPPAAAATNFVLEDELKLTASCLQRNPKAYAAWFHRKWTVRHWLLQSRKPAFSVTPEQRSQLLQAELGLCASFLDRDERNFHCWNYRRFIVGAMLELPLLEGEDGSNNNADVRFDGSWDVHVVDSASMGPQLALGAAAIRRDTDSSVAPTTEPKKPTASTDEVVRSEFEYTTQRIQKNFSNCSAFHFRSKLIDLVLDADLRDEGVSRNEEGEAYQIRLDLARGELETIQSAIFTEPDDQTAWWYHRFVLAWAKPESLEHWTDQDAANEAIDAFAEILEEERESIRELVDAEGGKCKWGLLALHMVLSELGSDDMIEESNNCLDQLIVLDPDRATRYDSMKRVS